MKPIILRQSNDNVRPDVKGVTDYVPFWLEPVSKVWLIAVGGVYQQFTCVNHTIKPSVSCTSCSYNLELPHSNFDLLKKDYIVRKLPTNPLPDMQYPQATIGCTTGLILTQKSCQ